MEKTLVQFPVNAEKWKAACEKTFFNKEWIEKWAERNEIKSIDCFIVDTPAGSILNVVGGPPEKLGAWVHSSDPRDVEVATQLAEAHGVSLDDLKKDPEGPFPEHAVSFSS